MTSFLNESSRSLRRLPKKEVQYLEQLFHSFLDACSRLRAKAFHGKGGAFTIGIYDAVFAAVCASPFKKHSLVRKQIDARRLRQLTADKSFSEAIQSRTAGKKNVETRLARAMTLLAR
jgi:hypothetical protein